MRDLLPAEVALRRNLLTRILDIYQRFGFEQIGEIVVPGGPVMIPMWRAPR